MWSLANILFELVEKGKKKKKKKNLFIVTQTIFFPPKG